MAGVSLGRALRSFAAEDRQREKKEAQRAAAVPQLLQVGHKTEQPGRRGLWMAARRKERARRGR